MFIYFLVFLINIKNSIYHEIFIPSINSFLLISCGGKKSSKKSSWTSDDMNNLKDCADDILWI